MLSTETGNTQQNNKIKLQVVQLVEPVDALDSDVQPYIDPTEQLAE